MKSVLPAAILILLVWVISCKKEESPASLSDCDQNLFNTCNGTGNGEYCTFGYKWGQNNPFGNAGLEKPGPASGQIQISYKFQEAGAVFNTHSQRDVKSESFDKLPACAKQKIREALASWEAVADIRFSEKNSNEPSDIKITVANITQGGVGYPAFSASPCRELAGTVVLKFNSNYSCEQLYALSVHEIGHALGLGHVASNNVMNPSKSYQGLQPGDIKGIQAIYGKK